jgi:hypothetical protein
MKWDYKTNAYDVLFSASENTHYSINEETRYTSLCSRLTLPQLATFESSMSKLDYANQY